MTYSASDYRAEIDCIEEKRWGELLLEFNDATLHQTWSSGAIKWGEKNLSHLILRRDSEVVAMAQISIRKLPFIKGGIATLYWGPLWRKKGRPVDCVILDKMIEELENEYVAKRGFLFRIWPAGFENSEDTISELEKHGYIRNNTVHSYRTLLLDLSPSLDELRKNLNPKWRNKLKLAEKSDLVLMEGSNDNMYVTFLEMLQETISRKNFVPGIDYTQYRKVQNNLPEYLKMKIFICTFEGKPVSGGVFSAIGRTGTYLLGATTDKGLKIRGSSNLINWAGMKWFKERGCQSYDLGGIDSRKNPGVYTFKRGIAGKSGKETVHFGQFYLSPNPTSSFLNFCFDRLNLTRTKLRKIIKPNRA